MSRTQYLRSGVVALVIGLTVLVAVPGPASAQLPLPLPPPVLGGGSNSTGTSATALVMTVLGSTTALASTGNLADAYDAIGAGLEGASGGLGSAEVLTATAVGSGDYVTSQASLGDLALSIAGSQITAAFVMAEATATNSGGTAGSSSVDALAVNGVSIVPTGAVNQTIVLGVLTVVLNEVSQSASGITVNALHISTSDGLVDVVVASATATIP